MIWQVLSIEVQIRRKHCKVAKCVCIRLNLNFRISFISYFFPNSDNSHGVLTTHLLFRLIITLATRLKIGPCSEITFALVSEKFHRKTHMQTPCETELYAARIGDCMTANTPIQRGMLHWWTSTRKTKQLVLA